MTPGTDCNDTVPNINPGAVDVIGNQIDDDCDGQADNQTSNTEICSDGQDNDSDGLIDCDDTVDWRPILFVRGIDLERSIVPMVLTMTGMDWLIVMIRVVRPLLIVVRRRIGGWDRQ